MEWITLNKSRYLSVDTMNAIYNNLQYINSLLPNIALESVDLADSGVTYNIPPSDILAKMNAVEANITAIHSELKNMSGWKEKHYVSFIWQENTPNKKREVDRWIDWLNDVLFMLQNTATKEELLTDQNGENISDQSGEQIYTKERIFYNGNI